MKKLKKNLGLDILIKLARLKIPERDGVYLIENRQQFEYRIAQTAEKYKITFLEGR